MALFNLNDPRDPFGKLRKKAGPSNLIARLPRFSSVSPYGDAYPGYENILRKQDLTEQILKTRDLKQFQRSLLPSLSNIFNMKRAKQKSLLGG